MRTVVKALQALSLAILLVCGGCANAAEVRVAIVEVQVRAYEYSGTRIPRWERLERGGEVLWAIPSANWNEAETILLVTTLVGDTAYRNAVHFLGKGTHMPNFAPACGSAPFSLRFAQYEGGGLTVIDATVPDEATTTLHGGDRLILDDHPDLTIIYHGQVTEEAILGFEVVPGCNQD